MLVSERDDLTVTVESGSTRLGLSPAVRRQLGEHYSPEDVKIFLALGRTSRVYVPSFKIDRYPVTRARFLDWILNRGTSSLFSCRGGDLEYWKRFADEVSYADDAPIVGATFEEASAYCLSHGGRLPLEAEWVRAARGDSQGRKYCAQLIQGANWHPEVDPFTDHWHQLRSVRAGEQSISWCGVVDLVGNANEFTASPFSWALTPLRERVTGQKRLKSAFAMEACQFGRTFVFMEVGLNVPILCPGFRGVCEVGLSHVVDGVRQSSRAGLTGFRCCYEANTDEIHPELAPVYLTAAHRSRYP